MKISIFKYLNYFVWIVAGSLAHKHEYRRYLCASFARCIQVFDQVTADSKHPEDTLLYINFTLCECIAVERALLFISIYSNHIRSVDVIHLVVAFCSDMKFETCMDHFRMHINYIFISSKYCFFSLRHPCCRIPFICTLMRASRSFRATQVK